MPADPLDNPGSGDGVDDLERVFVVEHRSDAELTPDELEDRRRTKRIALWGLAVVAVVVAVSITPGWGPGRGRSAGEAGRSTANG